MLHDAFKRDRLAWEGQRGDLFFQLDDLLDIRDTKNQYGSIGYIQDLKVKLGGHRLDEFIDLVRKIPRISFFQIGGIKHREGTFVGGQKRFIGLDDGGGILGAGENLQKELILYGIMKTAFQVEILCLKRDQPFLILTAVFD